MKTRYQFKKEECIIQYERERRVTKKKKIKDIRRPFPTCSWSCLVVLGRAWWFWNAPCTHNAAND